MYVSINKRLGSLNTTFYFDRIKKEKTTTCFGTWPSSGWILWIGGKNTFCNALLGKPIYNYWGRGGQRSNLMAMCRNM
jgi:hypothetical protein